VIRILAFGLLAAVSGRLPAQTPDRCAGALPDSSWLAASPVYRDCEVDTPAKVRGQPPRLSQDLLAGDSSQSGCLGTVLEFVVDSAGRVEPVTARVASADSPVLAQAILANLDRLRFTPARRAGQNVRQLVVYTRKVSTTVSATVPSVSTRGGTPLSAPQSPALRSC
jgi:hypothetical protein